MQCSCSIPKPPPHTTRYDSSAAPTQPDHSPRLLSPFFFLQFFQQERNLSTCSILMLHVLCPCAGQGPSVMMVQPTQERTLLLLWYLQTTCQYHRLQEGTFPIPTLIFGPQTKKNTRITECHRNTQVEGLFSASSWAQMTSITGSGSDGHFLHDAMVGWVLPGSDGRMGSSRRDIVSHTTHKVNWRTISSPQPTVPTICRNLTSLGQSLQSLNFQKKIHTTFSESWSTGKGHSRIPAVPQWRASGSAPHDTKPTFRKRKTALLSQTLVQASFLWRQDPCNLKDNKQWSYPVQDKTNAGERRNLLETQIKVSLCVWTAVIFYTHFTN